MTRTPRYKQAVVIGGGLSGLAASRDLLQAGYRVTGLEAAPDFGGLASSFRLEGSPIERFYPFIVGPSSISGSSSPKWAWKPGSAGATRAPRSTTITATIPSARPSTC